MEIEELEKKIEEIEKREQENKANLEKEITNLKNENERLKNVNNKLFARVVTSSHDEQKEKEKEITLDDIVKDFVK